MWAPALAAALVTATVVAVFERRSLRHVARVVARPDAPRFGVGALAVGVAAVLVVVLPSPALPVAATAAAAVAVRLATGRARPERVVEVLGVPVLAGLFGVAVGLGALGRIWGGPASLLAHLDAGGTAVVAAASSVFVNNLPAASLLGARPSPQPFALLIGLNLGPNLFVSGSLAWVLWLRAARAAGAKPSLATASRMGAVAVPLSIAAAVGALVLTGSR